MKNSNTINSTRGHNTTKPQKATGRPKRSSMSGSRMRMHIDPEELDPNFHYAWISDSKGLLFNAKRAGYVHVETSEIPSWGEYSVDSANSSSSLVSMPVGHGVTGYLMKQPMEFYNEDRAEMDALVDAREADLKRELNSGNDGTYGKVEIE